MCKNFLKNRKSLKRQTDKKMCKTGHNRLLMFVLMGVLVISSISYMWLINRHAIMGYELSGLEDKVSQLKDKKQNLELTLTELQEINNIKTKAEKMNMVVVNDVEYLNVAKVGLALR